MADYKIANIKWLRDQGWSIPSSYADGLCPTYNEIVNEIPKDSITVDVNGTCIATSQAYSSNQLVCENDIHITIITEIIATLTLNNGTTVNIEGSGELTSSMIDSYRTTVTRAEIKNTCTSIGNGAFSSCSNLTSATIPNSVTNIGINAFGGCTSLTSIDMPNSVTNIGINAFFRCSSLTSVTISNSVTTIAGGAFASCTSLPSITIPNSVTTIAGGAFASCTSLPSITIPESVTYINGGILTACTSLERIIVEAVTPCTIDNAAFASTNDCPIYVPCESVNTYKTSWSQYADRITCDSVDCSVYDFTQYTDTIEPSTTSYTLSTSNIQQSQLNVQVVDSGGFVLDVIKVPYSADKHGYIGYYSQNTTTSSKQATIKYTSQDNTCEWEQTVTQKGVVDCTKYQFEDMSPTIDVSGTGLNYPTVAKTSLGPNIGPLSYLTGSTWITYQGTREEYSPDKFLYKISCSQNDGSAKTGSITFTNNDGCTFTATVHQNGKNVTVSLRGITPIDGNLDLVGTDYSMHCTWNNGVKTVECSNTPNTADTAQNIFISAGGVSYRDGSIIKSATLVNSCPSQSSTYFSLVSAQWSVYSDRYELDMLFSPCGT